MMLNHLGETEAADKIESATKGVLKKMRSMLAGEMGYSTTEIGDMVVSNM